MLNHPQNYDVTLGGQNPCNAAVLGGLAGVKQRLVSDDIRQSTQALIDAVQYGTEGKALVKQHFNHPDHSKFFIDMVKAGYIPTTREQRFSWYGPSVSCSNKLKLQQIIRKTKVNLVWDSSGKEGCVVYPSAYSKAKLLSLWLLMQQRENPEAKSLAFAIQINLQLLEPLCTLAQNLLSQLENFSL
jgi:hypothetical protein